MMGKGLTLSIIFQANALNYGEGIGNVSELKKLSRGDGQIYTFASRQSLRYDMVRLGHDFFDWNLQTVSKEKGTVQFKEDATIEDSVEMDLFGYMKTEKGSGSITREAVARITHAISLEPYKSDIDYLNNMGLAKRIDEGNNLANVEQHHSFYTYTVTLDLDRVGVDREIHLANEEKAKRVKQLLTVINLLNRQIRGRQENLSPLFVIGGMYDISNPFFYGRMKINYHQNGYAISTELLEDGLEKRFMDEEIRSSTHLGLARGAFANEEELLSLLPSDNTHTVQGFFDHLMQEVEQYYMENEHAGVKN